MRGSLPRGRSARVASPVLLAVCGLSGSGKTTLIAELVKRLKRRGLRVLAVKHTAYSLEVDREGKDSARLYDAGADVFAYDESQSLLRRHGAVLMLDDADDIVERCGAGYDVVLLEGHKDSSVAKIWLLSGGEERPPDDVGNVVAVLPPGANRQEAAFRILKRLLEGKQRIRRARSASKAPPA
jgi:molybdopterin-guanine dinucleotide biosynthesis protein B